MKTLIRQYLSVIIFSFSALAAIILGFLLPSSWIITWFRASGFYFIFAAFALWVVAFYCRIFEKQKSKEFLKDHATAIILASLLILGAMLTSPSRFRVLSDETNLISTSFSMHNEHSFHQPFGFFEEEGFVCLLKRWGKRPLFYPFLVYIVHSLFGYSAYNGFVVNIIIGWLALFAFYYLMQRWFEKFTALLAMIALASFPLFVLWTTSSGFEILNVLFLLICFILLDIFIQSKETSDLELLALTLVLLSQVRYESSWFVLCFASAALLHLDKNYLKNIGYRFILIPLLMLPVAWQRRACITEQFVEKSNFGFQNFWQNSYNNLFFFAGSKSRYGMIPVVFFLAIAGLSYGLWYLIRKRKSLDRRMVSLLLCGLLALLGQIVIIFSYSYGNLTWNITMRFGLIFLPFLVFFAIIPCRLMIVETTKTEEQAQEIMEEKMESSDHVEQADSNEEPESTNGIEQSETSATKFSFSHKKTYWTVAVVALLLYYWPIAAKNEAMHKGIVHRQYRLVLDYLEQYYKNKNILIITDRPGMYIIHRKGSVSFLFANKNHRMILRDFKRYRFKDILVIQEVSYQNSAVLSHTRLSSKYPLKTLFKTRLSAKKCLQISKVIKAQKVIKKSKK